MKFLNVVIALALASVSFVNAAPIINTRDEIVKLDETKIVISNDNDPENIPKPLLR